MRPPSPKEEIKLVPYRWEWEKLYAKERRNLEKEIGEHVLAIEHIGSTAVPEMSARPAIDILVRVQDIARLPDFEDTLNQMGYQRSSLAAEAGNILFEAGGRQEFTLRIQGAGGPGDASQTRFRDLLLADRKTAKDYKELKIKLARKHVFDLKRYSEEKGRWIRSVLGEPSGPV